MRYARGVLLFLIAGILVGTCWGEGIPNREILRGDVVVFYNDKMLDPEETQVVTVRNMYLPSVPLDMEFGDPVILEYDGTDVFLVDPDDFRDEVERRINEISATSTNSIQTLRMLGESAFTMGSYRVDLSYAMVGQFALIPLEGREGCAVEGDGPDGTSAAFDELLDGIDPKTKRVVVYVRGCEPVPIGLVLRALRKRRIHNRAEYLSETDIMRFGIGRRTAKNE